MKKSFCKPPNTLLRAKKWLDVIFQYLLQTNTYREAESILTAVLYYQNRQPYFQYIKKSSRRAMEGKAR